ncbi:MAG: phospholipid carrier-dependent glycosyltransferase [Candidatus Peribacteraceae bacterium]|nr:phospholipid carrier-dependent glycosyltransferase [Candidatus Peribacteraceae bacterium]
MAKGGLAKQSILFGLFVLLLSYFTYMHNYSNPPSLFWDENYHIASAQKYMNGIFFMEPHPPFGKLMIAAGEKLLNKNDKDDQFIGTDYGKKLPPGFSFAGYRLFPSLFGWLTALVFYGIFLVLSRKPITATLLSFLYIFDNAQIVHSRGAMLDSIMIFFAALLILIFLLLYEFKDKEKLFIKISILFGIVFALLMTTKVLGLIMVLLIPAFALRLKDWKKFMRFLLYAGFWFLITYIAVWQIHFSLGKEIQSTLSNKGYYQASDNLKDVIHARQTNRFEFFLLQWEDAQKFLTHYSKRVPALNLCKDVENGSPWFLWPIGARTISYRWVGRGNSTYSYLYLVPNPITWWLGFIGIILGIGFLVSSVLLPIKKKLDHSFLLLTFIGLYISYMIAISQLSRVMYIYHYFLPLIFSYIVIGIVFLEICPKGKKVAIENGKKIALLFAGVLIFGAYEIYKPFTYYEPIHNQAFKNRSIIRLWDMKCVGCETNNAFAKPRDK